MGIGGAILGTVASGIMGSRSADRAADAQVDAAEATIEEQRRQYDLTREDYGPYRDAGYNALAALQYELGLGPRPGSAPQVIQVSGAGSQGAPENRITTTGSVDDEGGARVYGNGVYLGTAHNGAVLNALSASYNQNPEAFEARATSPLFQLRGPQAELQQAPAGGAGGMRYLVNGQYFDSPEAAQAFADQNTFDYRGFEATPGYQHRVDEGNKAIERAAAARGMRLSSSTLKDFSRFNQNEASQEYGNYLNRLSGLAGTGQTATGSVAAAGQNYANQAGSALMSAGQARASGYAGQTNALNGMFNNLATIGGMQQAGYFGGGGQNANALSTPWAAGGFWG